MPLSNDLTQRLMHVTDLPSPPRVASEILELANDPELSLVQVAGVLSKDPALAAKILRIANSPIYARRRKSDSLRQALLVLGLNATLTLALGFSLVMSLRRDRPHALDYKGFWRRALLAATASSALAEVLGRRDGEELSLAALLQDIGMLALDKIEPELYRSAPAVANHAALIAHERASLGTDHAEVGVWLIERWRFGERLLTAVGVSHHPEELPADSPHLDFARHVALSGELADIWFAEALAPSMNALSERAESLLGVELTQLATVLAVVRNQLPESEALYEIDLVAAAQAERILEHASELVLVRNLDVVQEAGRLRHRERVIAHGDDDSRVDAETGFYNREYLEQYLEREVEAARKQHWPVSVVCIHVDAMNAQLLKSASELLRAQTRESDLLARIGEQEFAIVLTGSSHDVANTVSERLITAFRDAALNAGEGNVYLGMPIAVGVESLDEQRNLSTAANLLRGAARAMYAANREGEVMPVSGFEAAESELVSPAPGNHNTGLLGRFFNHR
jgi:diguanylate cyclase (GGDEF)-like protein